MKSAEEFLAELNIKPGADLGQGIKANADHSPNMLDGSSADVAELSKQIEAKAVALLAMREHGAKELKRKLLNKFPETPELLAQYQDVSGLVKNLVDDVIERCQVNNWQSDDRFLEQAVRNYVDKGQGPMKIQQKLQQACSDSSLISAYLDWEESDWIEVAQQVLEKKYGDCRKPTAQNEQAKRMRFLQSRGFTPGTVWKAFK